MKLSYDALLLLSFGGPDRSEEVMPFLENVTRGRNIPPQRLQEVAQHYHHFGGKSPINEQNRALIRALESELGRRGYELPVYWGNRNWHPLLTDTLRRMQQDGVGQALAFFTSAFSSYSGCRQYRENIQAAQEEIGVGAPQVDKLRMFFNHPGFLEPMADGLGRAAQELQGMYPVVLFSGHSLPARMAATCRYEAQLREACTLCLQLSGVAADWELVYQSRSGPPAQPWLGPDICARIQQLHQEGVQSVIILPVGFISDHLEVLYDLDVEAADLCGRLGMSVRRVSTVGTDPRFVSMIVDLVEERCGLRQDRQALGSMGPSHDICPADCCPSHGAPGNDMPPRTSKAG